MVDFPHPETPMTITTAGAGRVWIVLFRLPWASIASSWCRGAIDEPVEMPDGANCSRGDRAVAGSGARDNCPAFPLPSPGRRRRGCCRAPGRSVRCVARTLHR